MKKLVKLSLAAAVATAGLTTAASAANLEEAIQGVKVSGFVSYTAESEANSGYTASSAEGNHDIDVRVQALIPVTDNITATVRVDERNDDDTDSNDQGTGGSTALNSGSLDLEIDRAFFTLKSNGTTVNAGLIGAPLTDGAAADGINVSKTFGSVTVGAGYLYTTGLGDDDVTFATLAGNVAPVAYSAAYATSTGNDYLAASLSTDLSGVSVAAYYGESDVDNVSNSQYKVAAKTTVGPVAIGVAYAANDELGGETLLDGSDVAASNISVGSLDLSSMGDASAYQIDLSTMITSADKISATYVAATDDTVTTDYTAMKLNLTHAFAKNFAVSANYEINTSDAAAAVEDRTELTLGAVYSF
ncbi:major outer membrane protein [Poseidonibacter ostreae]|uniref:porin n=1 Tax=Poseidonibacter ostreae TaxID=2654171 RepID=UPI00126515E3|nr:porin [Poseidonibacter ostreae]KAB7887926.1 major outer membrane protein [Poseidonibacter ostreae]